MDSYSGVVKTNTEPIEIGKHLILFAGVHVCVFDTPLPTLASGFEFRSVFLKLWKAGASTYGAFLKRPRCAYLFLKGCADVTQENNFLTFNPP